ncbi:hypothetical protein [Pseudomonas protegens]|uniref:hypothetical protein n=1 Tax=Pseudomonas protegens TaxID=380021 RepID=UPI001B312272|nr:hypothetical protein [Pseudomonas protegens]MBP5100411.1 hypothetical protein [Pseudomonas protegens]QTU06110.1 hypothetical protein HUT25_10245 [Pseudomonas protegens]QTU12420.1 hypothetical protein HUT23_10935 [Pseudomonas protegens]QTU40202.1 hypothetical protein HUT24_21365 [Pseudomonas protegens]
MSNEMISVSRADLQQALRGEIKDVLAAQRKLRALLAKPAQPPKSECPHCLGDSMFGCAECEPDDLGQHQDKPLIHITAEKLAMLRGERKMQDGGLTYSRSEPIGGWTIPLYTRPAEQWQPIETAPKDGTEIILRKGDRITAGAWIEWSNSAAEFHATTGVYLGDVEYESGADWSSWDGGFSRDDWPTHWQPLPTPPQQ